MFSFTMVYYHLVYAYIKLKDYDQARTYFGNLSKLYNKEKEKNKANIDKLRILETVSPIKLNLAHSGAC